MGPAGWWSGKEKWPFSLFILITGLHFGAPFYCSLGAFFSLGRSFPITAIALMSLILLASLLCISTKPIVVGPNQPSIALLSLFLMLSGSILLLLVHFLKLTGRVEEKRRWSEGIHQAVEAK